MGSFSVVGIGPGHVDYILPVSLNAIEKAQVLIGGARQLKLFSHLEKEEIRLTNPYDRIFPYIRDNCQKKEIALLVSGDPCYHSLLGRVSANFKENEYEVYPGLSSFQLALSRIGRQWNDARFVSFHGNASALKDIPSEGMLIMLTDYKNTPSAIARILLKRGFSGRRAYIAENLSYENERIRTMKLEDIKEEEYKLCVMIIE